MRPNRAFFHLRFPAYYIFCYNRRSISQNLTTESHDRDRSEITNLKTQQHQQNNNKPENAALLQNQPSTVEKYGSNYIFGVRLCMCLCSLIECFGESMIVPYFQRAMGPECTSDYFGALLSLSAIAKFAASIITGLYICELGADKCMIFSFLLNALSMTLIGFNPWFNKPKHANQQTTFAARNFSSILNSTNCSDDADLIDSEYTRLSFIISVVCFLGAGFASGGYITASYAIILDTFPETFSREIGFYEIFSGMAGGLAPLLAGAVLEYDNNFIYIGIMGGAIGFICFFCALYFLKKLDDCEPSKIKEALFLLKEPGVQISFFGILLGMGTVYALQPLISEHLDNHFIDSCEQFKAGLPWAVNGILYAILAPMWGHFTSDRPRRILVIGNILMMITIFCFDGRWFFESIGIEVGSENYKNQGFIHLVIMMSLNGAILGAPVIASYQEMNDVAMIDMELEPNMANRGLVSTCWNIGYSLSNVLGPSVFGFIGAKTNSFYWPMRIYGICLAVLTVPMLIYYKKNPRDYHRCDVDLNNNQSKYDFQKKAPFREDTIVTELSSS